MEEQTREQHLENIKKLLCDLGEDPERDGLIKTPERHLNSLKFLTSGYSQDASKILTSALFDVEYDEMVVVRDIEVYSLCEHHMLPFYGKCHVAYIPRKKVVGLSKIPRVVDIFCRRLQVQERLTDQISRALQDCLNPQGVGVVIEAYHLCMMMRGVEKQRSYTVTSSMKGSFRNQETRNEFLSFIRMRREV